MTFRDFWWEYRSEVFFGLGLAALTVFSYWGAAFIPEDIFEYCINPAQYMATISVCFYGAWVLYRHLDNNRLRIVWARTLVIWGLIDVLALVLRYGFGIKAIGGTPDDPLYNASLTLGNLLAWLLFVYPSMVLRPDWLTWKKAFYLLSPVILLGIIDFFVKANLIQVIMIYPVVIFVLLCRHISKYRQWCEENFSTMDNIDVQWIVRYLIMLFIAGMAFYFIGFVYLPNRMFTQQWLLFLIIAYSTEQILYRKDPWALLMDEPADTHADETAVPQVEKEERTTFTEKDRILFEQWMIAEKPYLNPDFQLNDLRAILPVNRTYLSRFVNAEYGCSFYKLVNRYRVAEAKRIMHANPKLRVAEVALQCGYSSVNVFSRIFVQETGMAPRDWLRQSDQ